MLDGGPSRVPSSTSRQTARRITPARVQTDEALPIDNRNIISDQRSAQNVTTPPSRRLLKAFVGLLIVALLGIGLWYGLSYARSSTSSVVIATDKYQAVFLTNGNVFFGKLEIVDDRFMRMKNIFYPEASATTEADGEQQLENATENTTKLIPFNEHLYGPEDEMMIDRDQVVFFMNLKSDSGAGKLIRDHQAAND